MNALIQKLMAEFADGVEYVEADDDDDGDDDENDDGDDDENDDGDDNAGK